MGNEGHPEAAWVAERVGVDVEEVIKVLDLEMEYLWRVGISRGPHPGTRYYQHTDLVGSSDTHVDGIRLALDAERLAGIDRRVANRIMVAEMEYRGDIDRATAEEFSQWDGSEP